MDHPISTRTARIAALHEALKHRILVLDGAMGTMVQRHQLTEEQFRGERFRDFHRDLRGNNDLLTLTRPDVIRAIHSEYLESGADILETNAVNSTSISRADYELGHIVAELNFEAAKLAREVADGFSARTPGKPRFVAGVLGPMNRTLSLSPDVNDPGFRAVGFDQVRDAYKVAVESLIRGGVDLLLVETIFDTLNAKAALVAIDECFEEGGIRMPIMISGTITDASGRTLSGQTAEAFWNWVRPARPLSGGSKVFSRLVLAGDYAEALSVARHQVENGAQVIDINMDEAMLDSVAAMTKFLQLVAAEPDIARVPIMIDSSRWSVIEAGLKCVQGKSIVNSISLKEGEEEFVKHAKLARRYGAAAIVMAFDEKGQADSLQTKTQICERCYRILTEKVGFPPEDIILDPNIFAVPTGIEETNTYGRHYLEALAWIHRHLPHTRTSAGVSNLPSSFPGHD